MSKKPLVQKGFLEDSMSSCNLTMMNNRNYSLKQEPQHINCSFQSFQQYQPVQENVLSESQEDLLHQFRYIKHHNKLNSMDAGHLIPCNLPRYHKPQQSMQQERPLSRVATFENYQRIPASKE